MKNKLDPKIIRVGDSVRIINPLLFIRCGYPLCFDDVSKDVGEKFGNSIEELIEKVRTITPKDSNSISSLRATSVNPQKDRVYTKILQELSYIRMRALCFGGNERSIYTELYEPARNEEFWVSHIRICKTGTYTKGWSEYSYDGECDYQPSYLENCKTHKILELCGILDPYPTNPIFCHRLQIESIHVEKLGDYRDKLQGDIIKGAR